MLASKSLNATFKPCHRRAFARPSRTQATTQVQCVARPSVQSRSDSQPAYQQSISNFALTGLGLAAPFIADIEAALAKDGEYGILEGKSVALLHPIIMLGLFGASVYAAYLGWQWRRTRTIGEEIRALKAQKPKVAVAAGGDSAPAAPEPSPLDAQIAGLEKERKELVAGGFKDRHSNVGYALLGGGVTVGVAGCFNTYMRTGKLFPGPHLYAGAGIVVLWALAASLVPAMQKGDNNARNAHIALNAVNVALFAWQIPTGWDIVQKVWQFAPWP